MLIISKCLKIYTKFLIIKISEKMQNVSPLTPFFLSISHFISEWLGEILICFVKKLDIHFTKSHNVFKYLYL